MGTKSANSAFNFGILVISQYTIFGPPGPSCHTNAAARTDYGAGRCGHIYPCLTHEIHVQNQIGPAWFSRVDVRWIQTYRQTKYIYIEMLNLTYFSLFLKCFSYFRVWWLIRRMTPDCLVGRTGLFLNIRPIDPISRPGQG